MSAKTIKFDLSVKSIGAAIKELKEYKQKFLKKQEEFVKKLAEVGIPVINQYMAEAGYTYDSKGIESGSDTSHNTYVKINSFGDYSKADLVVEGRDILFVEFGAGIHYNGAAGSSPHPKGTEFGYTIGSYGKGLGKKNTWGYEDSTGAKRVTYGTKATMPMYHAYAEISSQVEKIAKEVFGS